MENVLRVSAKKAPPLLLSGWAISLWSSKKPLKFLFRVYPDLHPLKYLHILIC
jgi:hypothetical protein